MGFIYFLYCVPIFVTVDCSVRKIAEQAQWNDPYYLTDGSTTIASRQSSSINKNVWSAVPVRCFFPPLGYSILK